MSTKLVWGIVGAGNIAKAFADGIANSKTGTLLAIASRSKEKAEAFGKQLNVERRYGSYEELFADKDVQAVYISTPHPQHAEWTIKACEAGKHVLCEKPIGVNHAETMAMVEAARANNVFLMEAFMYRCHPQTKKVVELVKSGVIGDVRVIKACFSFNAGFSPTSRLFCNDLAGGGILDVGCYAVSFSRLIAGVAQGKDFADPTEVTGCGHLGETGVDEWAIGSLRFPGDIVAEVATGVRVTQDNDARIFGSEGVIRIPSPWVPARNGESTKIIVERDGKTEEIVIEPGNKLFAIEADTVAEFIPKRQAASPAMSWADSLGQMMTLDRWRAAIGLAYDMEKPARQTMPFDHRPLARPAAPQIPCSQVPHLDKPLSRLVMGVDNQASMPHAAAMFDDFFRRGGTCFDTAYCYGQAKSELLGHWIKSRGVAKDVAVIVKGVHTPQCFPHLIAPQLDASLQWLQLDCADIYFMHRDNPKVPVSEFVEALNELVKAGRIKAFGGSNWPLKRVAAANRYAKKKGLQGFSAVSNNFSLAEMVEAVWDGCIHCSDDASRRWLAKEQMPVFAWSSQARGFFLDGASGEEIERCWTNEANVARRERARALAAKLGVAPINIALAYVLNQKFPTFALVGPRLISETVSSCAALGITLTPKQCKWLWDGTGSMG